MGAWRASVRLKGKMGKVLEHGGKLKKAERSLDMETHPPSSKLTKFYQANCVLQKE